MKSLTFYSSVTGSPETLFNHDFERTVILVLFFEDLSLCPYLADDCTAVLVSQALQILLENVRGLVVSSLHQGIGSEQIARITLTVDNQGDIHCPHQKVARSRRVPPVSNGFGFRRSGLDRAVARVVQCGKVQLQFQLTENRGPIEAVLLEYVLHGARKCAYSLVLLRNGDIHVLQRCNAQLNCAIHVCHQNQPQPPR